MSDHKVESVRLEGEKLEGWDGPVIPRDLSRFRRIFRQVPLLTRTEIKDAARSGFKRGEFDITIPHDHDWFCGLRIDQENFSLMILFPEPQSENEIAVYAKGKWSIPKVTKVLWRLTESMQSVAMSAKVD